MDFRTETERKFVVTGWTFVEVVNYLTTLATPGYTGRRHDVYWKSPNVDYIRLNTMTGEQTVKVTDTIEGYTRIEESIRVPKEDVLALERMNQLLYGHPTLQLHRTVSTFTVATSPAPDTFFPLELVAYQMDGDNRVFFEVEGEHIGAINHFLEHDAGALGADLAPVTESIYTLFTQAAK